jgi:hypothetical protein
MTQVLCGTYSPKWQAQLDAALRWLEREVERPAPRGLR